MKASIKLEIYIFFVFYLVFRDLVVRIKNILFILFLFCIIVKRLEGFFLRKFFSLRENFYIDWYLEIFN